MKALSPAPSRYIDHLRIISDSAGSPSDQTQEIGYTFQAMRGMGNEGHLLPETGNALNV